MTAVIGRAAGGAIFSNLVILLLLGLAVGLYLQIVIVEHDAANGADLPAASVRIVEQPLEAAGPQASSGLVPLPADQLQLIRQVFAPEMQ